MVAKRAASTGALAALVIGLGSITSCGTSDSPADAPTQSSARPRGGRSSAPVADLDLRGMLPPVPEYEGQGRNLFVYGAARRPAPRPTPRPPTTTPGPQPRATSTIPRAATMRPGTRRVDVKYAGFVEKTEISGNKAKYAIFLDGNEILTGAEGEIVANRFTVVEIGLESVTVSAEGSTATQRIPLQAN